MVKKLENMTEEELVERQIELSNKRAEAQQPYIEEQLEVQAALDRMAIQKKFDRLSDAEKVGLRELLNEEEEENEDG